MTTLYFDCFAGAAGDMILGALIDAGVPLAEVQQALGTLGVDGVSVSADRVLKTGVAATRFRVHEHQPATAAGPAGASPHRHYHLTHIFAAIGKSALSPEGRARATRMFERLADAEAAIHGTTMEKVHLHEVGAVDSIIDIVGTVFAMERLGATRVVASPVNVGGGMVSTAHGVFPVPAPATVRLLGTAPQYSDGTEAELLTPTGALILTEYAESFGPMPAMRVARVGYGAGERDLPATPNVVRVFVGEAVPVRGHAPAGATAHGDHAAHGAPTVVVVMACEIDDMNPQIFGVLMDRLYEAGALEVFYQPVQMKKNRPGTLMTIVARPDHQDRLADLVFRESTTIGIRFQEMSRLCLERELVPVETPLGVVRFKVARRDGQVVNVQPEFDDMVRLAAEHGLPVKAVQAAATRAWLETR